MKNAEQILAEVTGIEEWMGDTYIVTQIQAVEAIERYAAQLTAAELFKKLTDDERAEIMCNYCTCCYADESQYKCYCCPNYDE